MDRVCLYFIEPPESDRWLPGDRFLRPLIRRLIRGRPPVSGVERVFLNLCSGLETLGVDFEINLPFSRLRPADAVGVLGRGVNCLSEYDRPNPVVAGIGVMAHPAEAPDFCDRYPIAAYLQHSQWVLDIFSPYFGNRCRLWACGIDTEYWNLSKTQRPYDFLLYDKILWDRARNEAELLGPIRANLEQRKLRFREIRYGHYTPDQYRAALAECRAMLFLCEHESQGFAYQECLASGVPVLAWNQGWWLDPNRFRWGTPIVPATAVPFWDQRCGEQFHSIAEFEPALGRFIARLEAGEYRPREYVLEHLTLEKCARDYVTILREAADSP